MKFILALLFSISALASETITLTEKNTVFLNDRVDSVSVTEMMVKINELNQLEDNTGIFLVLNTPGGSIFDGIEFIRFAKASRRPINTITISAASMGFQIVEALPGKRLMVEYGMLMSHRPATQGLSGQFNKGELESRLEFIKAVTQDLDIGAAKRSGKYSVQEYQALIKDEYYALPKKAIADGFADQAVQIECDASLNGTKDKVYQTPFGPITATFSKCPLITGVLSAKFGQESDKNKSKDAMETLEETRNLRIFND